MNNSVNQILTKVFKILSSFVYRHSEFLRVEVGLKILTEIDFEIKKCGSARFFRAEQVNS